MKFYKYSFNTLNYYIFATVFGSGLFPICPGTITTIIAIILWLIIYFSCSIWVIWLGLLFLVFFGIVICECSVKYIKIYDHKSIVLDEFIGMWLIMTIISKVEVKLLITEFILFRYFDIIKPWPINICDNKLKGGFGIVFDDLIAAIFTIVFMKILL
uniref:Phosphatidylglycerophosphatase A n=1 Tax=Candidatus Aschnera chinzeii TaxID=1485666 RepID=A0AAT9G4H1_9ENTR|nr:MAG: phosphatidylglycerophosphatase A [Candidatus Aschnera chinzeii]